VCGNIAGAEALQTKVVYEAPLTQLTDSSGDLHSSEGAKHTVTPLGLMNDSYHNSTTECVHCCMLNEFLQTLLDCLQEGIALQVQRGLRLVLVHTRVAQHLIRLAWCVVSRWVYIHADPYVHQSVIHQ
jgi:hypothetical protein